ncbi:hypothetical protein BXT84_00570 [Sulfobacillus thermotolerans]|uniref:Nudix hydrolase domain-containing protein n=1 Tax=Sulfobacillus thermotolerans TaxID=338644 RepID=A0ABN5GWB9_9FIRM|nr:hypothetical protein BXT84_00570 [Sulfobacillus thermotolerans]
MGYPWYAKDNLFAGEHLQAGLRVDQHAETHGERWRIHFIVHGKTYNVTGLTADQLQDAVWVRLDRMKVPADAPVRADVAQCIAKAHALDGRHFLSPAAPSEKLPNPYEARHNTNAVER